MSSEDNEDVSSIVQSFVESDLANLDNAATHTDSLQLNSKYAEPLQTKSSALTGPPRTAAKTSGSLSASASQPAKAPRSDPSQPLNNRKTSSSTSSVESDQRRSSLGDKFKIFGRRIASNNQK